MSLESVRVSPQWLALRESADAAARSSELVGQLPSLLPSRGGVVIHDLGCGTAGMARWLAPQLPGPQHWVLYDRDTELLAVAAASLPRVAADGTAVTGETRRHDVTRLGADELAGASLVTVSALLDMLTADEVDRLVTTCAGAGCPALITGSVIGRVELRPDDSLDNLVMDAFNDHQRRATGGPRLLGPDAVDAAVAAFTRLGSDVVVRPSPWRLGAADAALTAEWFTGWVTAAVEQRPELAGALAGYGQRRLADAAAGRLKVVVQHQDLLILPR
ncbi:MAG: hypothetical protein QOJ90_2129 [Actinomycetota bacterium]|jgi:hypothetical protein|nr:hypothetical protein [Actinomycetota bacterium]MDQ1642778.1 hypothetical protein [Actinomycetota bacterium]